MPYFGYLNATSAELPSALESNDANSLINVAYSLFTTTHTSLHANFYTKTHHRSTIVPTKVTRSRQCRSEICSRRRTRSQRPMRQHRTRHQCSCSCAQIPTPKRLFLLRPSTPPPLTRRWHMEMAPRNQEQVDYSKAELEAHLPRPQHPHPPARVRNPSRALPKRNDYPSAYISGEVKPVPRAYRMTCQRSSCQVKRRMQE